MVNALKRYYTAWSRYHRSRGFGIHSPFAYYFVTNVMRQNYGYYAYESIEYMRMTIKQAVKREGSLRKVMSLRTAKLLYRIVNYFNPHEVLQIGSNYGMSAITALMVNSRSRLWLYDPKSSLQKAIPKEIFAQFLSRIINIDSVVKAVTDYPAALGDNDAPFVIINSIDSAESYSQLQFFINSILDSQGVVVFRNIANDRLMRQMWEESRQYAQKGMSFSNFRLAVFVARQSLPRQDFQLWF